MEPDPAASLLRTAVASARAAGALLMEGRGRARSVTTKSSATDMVSEMDRAAEDEIRSVIAAARPGDAILGEEGGSSAGAAGLATGVGWIVDPLDGTTNYLYGLPAWCVSVAATVSGAVVAGSVSGSGSGSRSGSGAGSGGGAVVAGAVFDPVHDELWTATAGGGAALNGTALPLVTGTPDRPRVPTLATALVATGFSYAADRRAAQGVIAARILPRVRDLRRAGSAALDLCWVAAGRVDAYYEEGTKIWDRAAGALIAAEAGAWVGGFDGGPPADAGVLAAHPALAGPLRELITGPGQ